jgi:DNA-binding transcriptional ArsR family regulator
MQADERIIYSIALELDTALGFAGGVLAAEHLSEELRDLCARVPADWLAQWPEFLGQPRAFFSLINYPALWAGVLAEPDYARATLPIRALTLGQALDFVSAQAARLGITADSGLPPAERLLLLERQSLLKASQAVGFEFSPDDALIRRVEQELQQVPRILFGGDLHSRFWHWMDRFYYEVYRPWRDTRAAALQALEQHIRTILADTPPAAPPPLEWLPPQSPLLRLPQLNQAIRSGQLKVQFWVEPFSLFDAWILAENTLITSFAETGAIYNNLRRATTDIAARIQALADPTRLMILRMMRYLSMNNTDIADFLELARPTVSVHAKILREAGLIETHTAGRQVRHTINAAAIRQLFADLERFLDLPEDG